MWKVFEDGDSAVIIGSTGIITLDGFDQDAEAEYIHYPFEDADYGTITNGNDAEHMARSAGYRYTGG